MSHNCHSAPVRFKLTFPFWDVLYEFSDDDEDGDIHLLPAEFGGKKLPETLRGIHRACWLFAMDKSKAVEYNGWKPFEGRPRDKPGVSKKFQCISAHGLKKAGHEVWYVDESQYSSVGHGTPAFFAFDKASLEALRKDIGGGNIEEDTTVESWW